MTKKTVRFQVRGGRLVPLEPVDLVEGAEFQIEVDESALAAGKGSPAAILAAMRRPPHVDQIDVDELERAIEDGKLPVRSEGIFDQEKP